MSHEYKLKNDLKNKINQAGHGLSLSVSRLKKDGVDVHKLIAIMPDNIEVTIVPDTSRAPTTGLLSQSEYLVLLPAVKKR